MVIFNASNTGQLAFLYRSDAVLQIRSDLGELMDLIVNLLQLSLVDRQHLLAERFLVLQHAIEEAGDLLRRESERQIKLNRPHLLFGQRGKFPITVVHAHGRQQLLLLVIT